MNKIPALTGWIWIKEGFALFRKHPTQFTMMFTGYLFVMLGIGIIPILGQLMPLLLAPVFSMLFMQAGEKVDRGQDINFSMLLSGLRSPAFRNVLKLGVLYLVAAVLVIGASSLVDGGMFWKAMSGQAELEPGAVQQSGMLMTMLIAALLYLPAAMAFWYAAPLIVWQKMGVFKAIFYSFFAVFHSGRAFLVYGAAWIVLGIMLPSIVSVLIAVLIGRGAIVMILMFTFSIVLTVIMYCSFYSTYVHVFGKPKVEEAE